jgi:hypothetical protein
VLIVEDEPLIAMDLDRELACALRPVSLRPLGRGQAIRADAPIAELIGGLQAKLDRRLDVPRLTCAFRARSIFVG